jgi:hypothetical protein
VCVSNVPFDNDTTATSKADFIASQRNIILVFLCLFYIFFKKILTEILKCFFSSTNIILTYLLEISKPTK